MSFPVGVGAEVAPRAHRSDLLVGPVYRERTGKLATMVKSEAGRTIKLDASHFADVSTERAMNSRAPTANESEDQLSTRNKIAAGLNVHAEGDPK